MAAWEVGGQREGGGGGPGEMRRVGGWGGEKRVLGKESPGKGMGYWEGEFGRKSSRKVGGHQRSSAGRGPWSPGGGSLPAIELVSFM